MHLLSSEIRFLPPTRTALNARSKHVDNIDNNSEEVTRKSFKL
jgi:hypothetical protein